jgi:hypothetical protein
MAPPQTFLRLTSAPGPDGTQQWQNQWSYGGLKNATKITAIPQPSIPTNTPLLAKALSNSTWKYSKYII